MSSPTFRRLAGPIPIAAFVCAALCYPGAAPATRHPAPPFTIVAGPYVKKEPDAPPQPIVRFFLKGLTVEAEFLEPPERARFIGTIAPGAPDPFAVPGGMPENYHAFRVRFDNRSPKPVTFQAGNVLLITDRNDQQFPIDLTDVYRSEMHADSEDPERAIARVSRLIFDSSMTIPPGGELARLLVFGPLPEKWREFQLHFSFLQIGTDTHTLSFAFHRRTVSP